MANINAGTSVSATNFNALFTRLNAIRANHLNKNGQNATANSTFATAFATNVVSAGGLTYPSAVQQIKTDLTTLAQSAWIDTTFAAKITIPSAGNLMQATNFNLYDNTITEVEAICPNYSQYSQYSQYTQYNHYDKYSAYSAVYRKSGNQ